MGDHHDPDQPGYQPEYGPGGRGTGAGSGPGFGADLHAIYHAGRVRFPQIAAAFHDAADELWYAGLTMASLSESMESPRCMTLMLRMREDLQLAAYKSFQHCQDAGEALVAIADDYVRTDQEALGEFNRLLGSPRFRDDYTAPTPHLDDPHHPSDEPVEIPRNIPIGP